MRKGMIEEKLEKSGTKRNRTKWFKIENLSDQLDGYAEEVFHVVRKIQEEFDLPLSVAIQIVDIATRDQQTDALHHIDEAICELSSSLDTNSYDFQETIERVFKHKNPVL